MNPIGLKWVFNVKSDGRYRARIVALGYRQQYGHDYDQTYSPMISDVTLRLILLMSLMKKWVLKRVDIKAAFLNSKLKEMTHVKLPDGWEEVYGRNLNEVGQLNAALYGLKQASRSFFETMCFFLKVELEMTQCKADCCVFRGINVFIGLYVDDILLCGEMEAVGDVIRKI